MTKKISQRGRPVDESKRDEILKIATKLFMKQGFKATHMDQIAQAAGMSKLTLYRRFPDKYNLFVEVMMRRCNEYVPETIFAVFKSKPAREAIQTFVGAMFSLVTSGESVSMYRMMVTESMESPKLASTFFKNGPQRMRTILEDRLSYLDRTKALSIKDPVTAADVMIAMVKGGGLHQRVLLNVGPKPTTDEIEKHIQNVTDTFMRAFAVER